MPTTDTSRVARSSAFDPRFRTGLDHLREFDAREGHSNVPFRHVTDDGFRLGDWVKRRRQEYRAGRLAAAKVSVLDALAMVWDPHGDAYQDGVEHLREFVAREGHANVPSGFVDDDGYRLGNWVSNHRIDYKAGRLAADRVTELDALGMLWSRAHRNRHGRPVTGMSTAGTAPDARFRAGVEDLRVFVAREGHARVPKSYVTEDGFRLGVWVSNCRWRRNAGTLSADREAELAAVGVVWGSPGGSFADRVAHLRVFVAREGHARVPTRYVTEDGFRLGVWVSNCRARRNAGTLSAEREAELTALGVVWSAFAGGVEQLRVFVAREGHARVPRSYVTDGGFRLGVWVTTRREEYRAGTLLPEREAELTALGMAWTPPTGPLVKGPAHLRVFVAREGHARVPRGYVAADGFCLGAWVMKCRWKRNAGTLSAQREAELTALGMVWTPRAAAFAGGAEHLRVFVAREGHSRVPRGYVAADGFRLGTWVNSRRKEYRAGRLSPEREAELTALGVP